MMPSQFPDNVLHAIRETAVVAVLVIDDAKHAVPLARALMEGGMGAMELTLRTPAAIDALRAVVVEVPEMLPGIGTILTPEQVVQVKEAGAAFGVAPGLNRRVVEEAKRVDLPFAPGVATPSDLEAALELGCRDVKFFPAEPNGGLPYLKSMAAPYAHLGVSFIPLGGLTMEHLEPYLRSPLVAAVGGSWLAPRDLIRDGN
ncbi:MAG: bifunctional 4-hydroxy-2-oxoglutarate aldolase/2-dehydro-3-deoxy-phosphogluconate aldolase, partial [Pirellulaceae bacterium]